MSRTEIHLHLPRALKGDPAKWSVKRGTERVHYAEEALLLPSPTGTPIRFAVQPAGHRRYKETGVRNVHALVRGELTPDWMLQTLQRGPEGVPTGYVPVRYDVEAGAFYGPSGTPVETADGVYFGNRLYALNPRG
jgi:hypothetical protein